jgi:hypothetical protein
MRLADTYAEHPDIMRPVTWQRLECGNDRPDAFAVRIRGEEQSSHRRRHRPRAGEGHTPAHFEARILTGFILGSAVLWDTSRDVLTVVGIGDHRQTARVVRDAVKSLLPR